MKQLQWIAAPASLQQRRPWLRRDFLVGPLPTRVRCRVTGLGFYVLFLNGERADSACLAPTPSRYDVRTWFREFDVTPFLKPGLNRCEIHLGGGWFAGEYEDVYASQSASYRSIPKAALRIFTNHRTLLTTDATWLAAAGPVLADSPRTGETFDARLLAPGEWLPARLVPAPGGRLVRSNAPPVREQPPVPPQRIIRTSPGKVLYDFGCNLTGVIRISLRGPAGRELVFRYGELLHADGTLSQDNLNWYLKTGECQTDRYILAGSPQGEQWRPDFSYHGFRYVEATLPAGVELRSVEAVPLRSAFPQTGDFHCGARDFADLLGITRRTLEDNFVGYPSDCPHREKNGWGADAHLAADSLLAWFDAAANYEEFIDTIFDYQRPSGQLPGMVPGSGHGWHWDFGPIWDSAALRLAHACWWWTGRDRLLKRHYQRLCRYLTFQRTLMTDDLMDFGPGDWCQPPGQAESSPRLVGTAYYLGNLRLMAQIAQHLGHAKDAEGFLAAATATSRRLAQLPPATLTEHGCLLECGIGGPGEAETLAARVRQSRAKALFGIAGAKAVPRALAAFGFIDDAYSLFVQPDFPGWQWMLRHGATTLWETWDGSQSQNHPMLGDAAGWALRFLAGIQPTAPGFREVLIAPQFPKALPSFGWRGQTPSGPWESRWKRRNDHTIELFLEIPPQVRATLWVPGQPRARPLAAGRHRICIHRQTPDA